MYTPPAFAETDPEILARFMRQHGFATLISPSDKSVTASHLPMLLECSEGSPKTLLGHMAKANDQWRLAEGREVLVTFQGPHAYISPRWYAEKNTVPTWNYAAVHAYGIFRVLSAADTRDVLIRTICEYETGRESPWSMVENDPELLEKLLPSIMGFCIELTRLEGKWKFNQNHTVARRERVIEQLRKQPGENGRRVVELMEQSLSSSEPV